MSDRSSTRLGTAPIGIEVGTALGSYELVGLLGKGAMGCVYRARHVRLGREVAIKVLNPEYVACADVVQRFFREARVVNDIDHEHIVEVTDFVEAPGLAYLVMELLDGMSLRELMKARGRKYPPLKRVLGLMVQVCEALEAAHDKGVVHRDLKPDNVFVVKRDGADFVKVLDFGVAKLRDSVDHAATTAGMILGTPHYMAPEQALGKDVDRHADVWAAGVVLFELLAGAVPFTAPSFVELAMCIREQPPKPLPRKTPRGERIPAWLAAVVTKCLEKRPGDRFRSMGALAEALRQPRHSRTAGRARRLVAAALAAAILVAGASVAVRLDLPRRLGAALDSGWRSVQALASRHTEPSSSTPASTSTRTPSPTSTRTATPTRTPTKRATSTPRAAAPSAAAQRTTVELVLRSTPPGASVVLLETGQRLGKTPVRVNVARKAAVVWIRMALDGYAPVKFAVDLRKDNAANVTLRGVAKKPTTSRRR